jgi:endoglucanase
LGVDVIRLPINLHYMTEPSNVNVVDPLLLKYLDEIIDWAASLDLHLILDNHTFDPIASTTAAVEVPLTTLWPQIAARYKDGYPKLYYEVLNEPHGITFQVWNEIQQKCIDAIRKVDGNHFIIVGGVGYNSFYELKNIKQYTDKKLIYTFHFYDPFLFTHQGATWTDPSMGPLANMPFPYDAAKMPGLPPSLKNTWVEQAYNGYKNDGTITKVKELIDIAFTFGVQRNVPIFCGEFGVYIPNSDNKERVKWYEEIRKHLEFRKIAWTMWDYHGGFGLYTVDNGFFDNHLNIELVKAVGFNAPPQTPYILKPDSVGFEIFTDQVGQNIIGAGYGSDRDYNASLKVKGSNSFSWAKAQLYSPASFEFKPIKDLSLLKEKNFAIDFWVKSTEPNLAFDVRFVDTKSSATDRPWRNRVKIDKNNAPSDGKWHHVHIPFSAFEEQGAWDNAWYNPQGLFDWKAIDRLEFSTEYAAIGGTVFFDNIIVTDRDTATITSVNELPLSDEKELTVSTALTAKTFLISNSSLHDIEVNVMNSSGSLLKSVTVPMGGNVSVDVSVSGVYFLKRKVGSYKALKIAIP